MYDLAASNDGAIELSAIDTELAGTIYAGKLHFSRTTGSTNTDAMAAARSGAAHGSVYFADEQTAGRGRGNHRWHSAAGEGLYVSVVLRLEIPAARLALLPLAAGLAAADSIRTTAGVEIDLRWPNDLLIGPRKVGGILVEASAQAARAAFAVVGIGINVHQQDFDPGLDTPATSLDLETGVPGDGWLEGPGSLKCKTGRRVSRQALLVALLKSLEREAMALADSESAKMIVARVEEASTWVRGRRVQVHGPQACTGVTTGLDENGFLRVETVTGTVTVQTGGLRAEKG